MDGRRLSLPIWGGVECTVARVGDRYVDQTLRTGHHDRDDDIDRIASLGVRALRYPVLWERSDWEWTDRRLRAIRDRGVEPIATLLHHGSGPPDTNLLDPQFPAKLASYAREVAGRYPWLRYFTPVNEPLTTARFSALYGVWYPHAVDDGSFLTALVNETLGTAAAMRAIREVIPDAQLVQTEDLSRTFSTAPLELQARFENARRFAVFDLLTGRVDASSLFFAWATKRGLRLDKALLDAAHCPPDVIGLNYYITSERFLDHRIDRYPGVLVGGNDKLRYVDVEAVRVCDEGIAGLRALAREYWNRYRIPIAVTEAHLGCTPDEQLRWLADMYSEACGLLADGVDIRGFTVWSLFGSYDWDSLLTQERGSYEPGAFDVRGERPAETLIAHWMRAASRREPFAHPALHQPGWWRRESRLLYGLGVLDTTRDIA